MITTLTFKSKLNNISGLDYFVNPVGRECAIENMKDRAIVKDEKVVGAVTGVDLEKNEFTGVLWCELDAEIVKINADSYIGDIQITI